MKNCGSTQNICMINLQRPYSFLQKTSLNFFTWIGVLFTQYKDYIKIGLVIDLTHELFKKCIRIKYFFMKYNIK